MQAWYDIIEARLLIASCAARRPKAQRHVQHYALTCDEWLTYAGRRADRLREIRTLHLEAALFQAASITDRAAATRFLEAAGLMVTVEDAIDAAVQAKAVCRRAA